MSKLSQPLSRNPDQLSPPLGELDAAIREYLRADQLGEDAPRRVDLALPVRELCLTCRPKHHEHEMSCTDGTTANVVWTYSTIIVGVKDRDGRMVGGWTKGRLHPDMPGELDRELDRVLIELARVGYERAWGERTKDERGRPLPVPATDRLLAIADRIEAQQAGGGSAAQQVEAQAPVGEWSKPMSKKVLMKRLGLGPRAFETFAKPHGLREISRQQWQIRLDKMDAQTRRHIESER